MGERPYTLSDVLGLTKGVEITDRHGKAKFYPAGSLPRPMLTNVPDALVSYLETAGWTPGLMRSVG